MRAWLHAAAITHGPAFRGIDRHGRARCHRAHRQVESPTSSNAARCRRAGSPPPSPGTAWALRRGHATQASGAGAPLHTVQAELGHTSVDTTIGSNKTARAVLDSSFGWLWN